MQVTINTWRLAVIRISFIASSVCAIQRYADSSARQRRCAAIPHFGRRFAHPFVAQIRPFAADLSPSAARRAHLRRKSERRAMSVQAAILAIARIAVVLAGVGAAAAQTPPQPVPAAPAIPAPHDTPYPG